MRQKVSGLYAITPDTAHTEALVMMTQQALSGGARLIQYRNKTAGTRLLQEQARALRDLCQKYHALLIINDNIDIAIKVNADGVHLGEADISLIEAREKLGRNKIIGASCYNRLELAFVASAQSADYVAFGAFFISITKPRAVVARVDLLRLAKQKLSIPVVAIGGITSANAVALINCGCDAIAVNNSLFGAKNISSSANALSGLFE